MKELQSKINYLIKDDEKNSIGNKKRLLGFMNVEEDLYKEIQIEAQQIVKFSNNNRYQYTYVEKSTIVTMAAVLFCMYEVNGSRFWEELSEKYQMQEHALQSEIKGYISSFISTNSLPYYKGTNRNEYVETIQMQSVIPHNYTSKLIRAIYFMYLKDLDKDISDENINALLKYLSLAFTKQIKSIDNKNELNPTFMTIQLQSIPKSFMQAYLTQNRRMKSLIKRYLLFFDKLNKRQTPNYNQNNRFDMLFQNELKTKAYLGLANSVRNPKKEIVHKPAIKARLKNESSPVFYIVIPQHYINPEMIKKPKAAITFYSQQKPLREKEIGLIEGGISWKTIPTEYELKSISNELSYKVSYDNTTLFDSKKSLYKEYILFDDQTISDEVQLTDVKVGQYFYLLVNKKDKIIFKNNTPVIKFIDCGVLYYFKVKKEMKVILNNQVLFDNVVKENLSSEIEKTDNKKISVTNSREYYNDLYLNMIYIYEDITKKRRIINYLANKYKKNSLNYYLSLFEGFENLIAEEKELKSLDGDMLTFVLEILYKAEAFELLKISLEKIHKFIKGNSEARIAKDNMQLMEICQSYARQYSVKLDFSMTQKVEDSDNSPSKKRLKFNDKKLLKKETTKQSLIFSIPSDNILLGLQSLVKVYFERDNSELQDLNLLNRLMGEYKTAEVGSNLFFPVIDKEIFLNHVAFNSQKNRQLKLLASINGDIYYWIHTIDLEKYPDFLKNANEQYTLKITDGRSYSYSFEENCIIMMEGNYQLELCPV